MERWWNDTEGGKRKYSDKNLPQCYSNTNPTWTGVELKPVLCAEMPANYCGFNLGLFGMMFHTRVEREPCFMKQAVFLSHENNSFVYVFKSNDNY